jgi:hypothetical protein
MDNTGVESNEVIVKNLADRYSHDFSIGSHRADYFDKSWGLGSGSIYSTIEDLYRWNRAFAADRILTAESRELMTTPIRNLFGYGCRIGRTTVGEIGDSIRHIWHAGGNEGVHAGYHWYPEQDYFIAILCNYREPWFYHTSVARPNEEIVPAVLSVLVGQPYHLPQRSVVEALVEAWRDRSDQTANSQLARLTSYCDARDVDCRRECHHGALRLLHLGESGLAERLLRTALDSIEFSQYEDKDDIYFILGDAALAQGDTVAAIEAYDQVLAQFPDHSGAAFRLRRLEGMWILGPELTAIVVENPLPIMGVITIGSAALVFFGLRMRRRKRRLLVGRDG